MPCRASIVVAMLVAIAACAALVSAQNANPRIGMETSAVKKIDDRTTEITNKRGGKVAQVIINVLSPDGKRIDNTYKNYNESGELTSTTTAIYERMP
jgi:hypothetical protein